MIVLALAKDTSLNQQAEIKHRQPLIWPQKVGTLPWLAEFLMFSPSLLAVLIMLPRLFQPNFGLLDDGQTLRAASKIDGNWTAALHMSGDTGRFVPMYWIYYYGVFKIAGASPLGFFATQCILLTTTIAGLIYFARLGGATRLQAGAAGLFFAASGPVIESFYTLSKPEPVQVFFLLASLILMEHCARQTNVRRQMLLALGIVGSLVLANTMKETSLMMIPISVALLGAALVRKHFRPETSAPRPAVVFVLACGAAGAAFLLLRMHFAILPISSGSYTKAYSFAHLGESAWRLVGWVIRDFPQLLPLGVFVCCSLARRKPFPGGLLFLSVIWMCFWIGVYLPWQASLEYHLLPFALGAAIFAGLAFGECAATIRQPDQRALKTGAVICLAVTVWLTQFTVVNNITNARLQLAVDRVNSKLVNFLGKLPVGSHVLINLPEPNEY